MQFSHKHKWIVEEVGEAAPFDRIIIQNLMTFMDELNDRTTQYIQTYFYKNLQCY